MHASKQSERVFVCDMEWKCVSVLQFALSFRPKTNIKTNEDGTIDVQSKDGIQFILSRCPKTKKWKTPHAFRRSVENTHIYSCIEALSCSCFASSSFDSMSLLRDLFVSHNFSSHFSFIEHSIFLLPSPSYLSSCFSFFLKIRLLSRMAMKIAVCALLLCMHARMSVCCQMSFIFISLPLSLPPTQLYTWMRT